MLIGRRPAGAAKPAAPRGRSPRLRQRRPAGGAAMKRFMKAVLRRPAAKSCSARIRRCSGTFVLIPSMTVISSVRRIRAIASWRSRPYAITLAIIES